MRVLNSSVSLTSRLIDILTCLYRLLHCFNLHDIVCLIGVSLPYCGIIEPKILRFAPVDVGRESANLLICYGKNEEKKIRCARGVFLYELNIEAYLYSDLPLWITPLFQFASCSLTYRCLRLL